MVGAPTARSIFAPIRAPSYIRKFHTTKGIRLKAKGYKRSNTSSHQGVSNFFERSAPTAQAWSAMVQGLADASALDPKTSVLVYLAVMAALRLECGIPFHGQSARQLGASRDEVIYAFLVNLPAAGHSVTQTLPTAIAAYDAK